MQTTIRRANDRGSVDLGWLQSQHTFSFGQYHDPNHMQFANLRVINDDIVQGGQGFGLHPHQNAEIFSYVLSGALAHKDTLGNGSTVEVGGVQFMSAGMGVSHSEFNPSDTEPMRFLQVWLLPEALNTEPYYENVMIDAADKDGKLKLFLSHDGREHSIRTHAKADVYCANLHGEQRISYALDDKRKVWIQIADGELFVNDTQLKTGDGFSAQGSGELVIHDGQNADFLLFDLM